MNFFKNKLEILRSRYHIRLSLVFSIAVAIFLLSVFDSIMSYLVPIIMTEFGLSELNMGLLYASSSFFGLVFDFVLAKILKSTNYKKTLISTLLVALLFPIAMFVFPGVLPFLIGMLLWGLYYNLWAFASADFTARESKVLFHVASVSMLLLFHDIGYIVGTVVAEPLYNTFSYSQMVWLLSGVVVLAMLAVFPALRTKKRESSHAESDSISVTLVAELHKLSRVAKRLLPLLILGVVASSIEAVIWTITPIIETILPQLANLGGIILAVNFLPSFIAYGISSQLTDRFGKKHVGIVTFILGTLVLALLGVVTTVPVYLTVSFISSFFISIAYAALGGAYADYLRESSSYDNEIIGTRDMATNLGYIIGPALGGALLFFLDSPILFTYLGISAAVLGVVILLITPKHIPFKDQNVK